MPPRKNSQLGRVSSGARRIRLARQNETPAQRALRLESQKIRQRERRENETPEERLIRLAGERIRQATRRKNEAEAEYQREREERLTLIRQRKKRSRIQAEESNFKNLESMPGHEQPLEIKNECNTFSSKDKTSKQSDISIEILDSESEHEESLEIENECNVSSSEDKTSIRPKVKIRLRNPKELLIRSYDSKS